MKNKVPGPFWAHGDADLLRHEGCAAGGEIAGGFLAAAVRPSANANIGLELRAAPLASSPYSAGARAIALPCSRAHRIYLFRRDWRLRPDEHHGERRGGQVPSLISRVCSRSSARASNSRQCTIAAPRQASPT